MLTIKDLNSHNNDPKNKDAKLTCISTSELLSSPARKSAYGEFVGELTQLITASVVSVKAQRVASDMVTFLNKKVQVNGKECDPLPENLYIKIVEDSQTAFSVKEIKRMAEYVLAIGEAFGNYELLKSGINPLAKVDVTSTIPAEFAFAA
jgi:hypothetical protein